MRPKLLSISQWFERYMLVNSILGCAICTQYAISIPGELCQLTCKMWTF